ncbi:MAG: hypothetical protein WB714_31670, partial [Candidatus Sulfotelmatobacter sp.]
GVVGSQGPPFSVTQLTSYFNPSPTADSRARGSVRRVSGFVQIAISLVEPGPASPQFSMSAIWLHKLT